jgi:hypothetical protein
MNKYTSFAKFVKGRDFSYTYKEKQSFHLRGRTFLKNLAKDLQLTDFEIRSIKGGIAVPGEIVLHSKGLYVMVFQNPIGNKHSILFRSTKGPKDYTGGQNFYVLIQAFADDPEKWIDRMNHVATNYVG